jgi:hypothetical protein
VLVYKHFLYGVSLEKQKDKGTNYRGTNALASTGRFFSRVVKLIIADKLNGDKNTFKTRRSVLDNISCETSEISK